MRNHWLDEDDEPKMFSGMSTDNFPPSLSKVPLTWLYSGRFSRWRCLPGSPATPRTRIPVPSARRSDGRFATWAWFLFRRREWWVEAAKEGAVPEYIANALNDKSVAVRFFSMVIREYGDNEHLEKVQVFEAMLKCRRCEFATPTFILGYIPDLNLIDLIFQDGVTHQIRIVRCSEVVRETNRAEAGQSLAIWSGKALWDDWLLPTSVLTRFTWTFGNRL